MTPQQVTTEPIRPENVIVDKTVTLDAISSYEYDCYTDESACLYGLELPKHSTWRPVFTGILQVWTQDLLPSRRRKIYRLTRLFFLD